MFFVVLKLYWFVRKKTIIPILRFILVSIFSSQCNVNPSSFSYWLRIVKLPEKKCIGKEIDYWVSMLDTKAFLNIGHNVNRSNVYVFNVYQKYIFWNDLWKVQIFLHLWNSWIFSCCIARRTQGYLPIL